MITDHPSRTLARFAAQKGFEDIPAPVLRRAEDLLLDWFGSAPWRARARGLSIPSRASRTPWARPKGPAKC